MNRIWAFSKVHGTLPAIKEAEKLDLKSNHFYYILLANLYLENNPARTREYLMKAHHLCKTATEKEMIQKQIIEVNKRGY
jgi:RNA polymerase sigma-70 factor (ECF subfamily)